MINIEDFDSELLKINKKSYKNVDIYHIGYIKIKSISTCNSSNCVNPIYFLIAKVDGYIEEQNENKYLTFSSTDKKRSIEKIYRTLGWN